MTASLRLVPVGKEECRTFLEEKGKTSLKDPGWMSPVATEEYKRHRKLITLKLCANTDDVIDVDDESLGSIEPETVRYASQYQDGSVAAIVSLGRSFDTGIKWTTISRALCDVSLTNASATGKKEVAVVDLATSPAGTKPFAEASYTSGESQGSNEAKKPQSSLLTDGNNDKPTMAVAFLSMRKPPGKHAVYLDGDLVNKPLGREVPIKDGTIISLYGPTGFAYKVEVSQSDNNLEAAKGSAIPESSSPKKRKANPPAEGKEKSPVKEKQPTARQKIRQRAHELMVGEFTCAMCMDILVKSTFAYPCSHAFCNECSEQQDVESCPTCRGKVEGWMPARSFDTIVWAAAVEGRFERDDAEEYLSRRETSGEPAPTDDERASMLNEEEGETSMKNGMMPGFISHNPFQPAASKVPIPIRTLPPANPAVSIARANNSIQNGGLVGSHRPPRQKPGKSAEDDVICID